MIVFIGNLFRRENFNYKFGLVEELVIKIYCGGWIWGLFFFIKIDDYGNCYNKYYY